MRRYGHYKHINLLLLVFSILLLNSTLQTGIKGSLIGLIKFSVKVYDNQELVENERNRIETQLIKFLDKNYGFIRGKMLFDKKEDIITYSDIEDPEVTIDPMFEARAAKKLKELSRENGLDAIVFGHFYEESDLIVVLRYYTAKEKKIVSTGSIEVKIDKDIQMNLKKAVDKLVLELEEKLKAKFGKKPSEEPDKKSTIIKSPEKYQKKIPADREQKTDITDIPEEALTARDVYKMIVDKKFYCEIVTGSPFHGEGLKKVSSPKNGIFRESRIVTAVKNNGLIKTENQSIGKTADKIILLWSPGKKNKCYYKKAVTIIEKLNNENKDKSKTWRIPTLMEVFSIVKEKTNNHFPGIFKFPPETDLIFWTSTPVKKEGTVLEYDNTDRAYFVVRSVYIQKYKNYALQFSYQNIEGNNNNQAYLLPVYSDKVYTYTPSGKSSDEVQ